MDMARPVEREPMWDGNLQWLSANKRPDNVEREPMWDGNGSPAGK